MTIGNDNLKIIITRGLPGSGKSTHTKNFVRENKNFIRISRDDIRFMLWDGDWVNEDKEVFLVRKQLMYKFLDEGYDLIMDETFLAPHRVKQLKKDIQEIATGIGVDIDVKIQDFIDVPLERCISNDMYRGRNRHVGEKFIRTYYDTYILPLLKNRGVTEWTVLA